jgi:hypothetical protein
MTQLLYRCTGTHSILAISLGKLDGTLYIQAEGVPALRVGALLCASKNDGGQNFIPFGKSRGINLKGSERRRLL